MLALSKQRDFIQRGGSLAATKAASAETFTLQPLGDDKSEPNDVDVDDQAQEDDQQQQQQQQDVDDDDDDEVS